MTYKNLEYERMVLAAIKLDNKVIDQVDLTAQDFYDPTHRVIYKAIQQLIDGGQEANDLSIFDLLNAKKIDVKINYLAALDVPSVANAGYYAQAVREFSHKRRLHKLLTQATEQLETREMAEILQELDVGLAGLTGTENHGAVRSIAEFVRPAMVEIERLVHSHGGLSGISTGIDRLDGLTSGLQDGELMIIGARPGVGKTALALTMLMTMTIKNHVPAGLFSCEMAGKLIAFRLLSARARLSMRIIKAGLVTPDDFSTLTTAAQDWHGAPLYINDAANITLSALRTHARTMRRMGVRIIFVDYLTLVQYGKADAPRHEQVGQISKSLKRLARELEVPIVVLSQVTRAAEGKMPTLADLRQSGEIEEDADLILFLDRRRQGDIEEQRKTSVVVAKNRNGETGAFELVFLPSLVRFENKVQA